jgi:uncharacterized protein
MCHNSLAMKNWALITGGSAGIGYELAKLFAADRFNLVLVARNEARLKRVAEEFRGEHGIAVKILARDLSNAAAPAQIFEELRDTQVSVLVNNAGFGWHGSFVEDNLQRSLDMMHVNMDSLVALTHLFAQPMLARREGRILNVASTAAFQPGPTAAIYFATKAFVYSFSCALAEELAGTGVTVTTLCPGSTRTEFHERARMQRFSKKMPMMDADVVAETGYCGFMKGKRVVIPGVVNKLTAALGKGLPERATSRVVRKLYKD